MQRPTPFNPVIASSIFRICFLSIKISAFCFCFRSSESVLTETLYPPLFTSVPARGTMARKGGDFVDREKLAHNIATAFAASENAKMSFEESQSKIEQFLEDYCAAYGFVMSRNESFIQELIQRGE